MHAIPTIHAALPVAPAAGIPIWAALLLLGSGIAIGIVATAWALTRALHGHPAGAKFRRLCRQRLHELDERARASRFAATEPYRDSDAYNNNNN